MLRGKVGHLAAFLEVTALERKDRFSQPCGKIAMEAFIKRDMEESQDEGLRTWDEQEVQDRKAEVLLNHDQGPLCQ